MRLDEVENNNFWLGLFLMYRRILWVVFIWRLVGLERYWLSLLIVKVILGRVIVKYSKRLISFLYGVEDFKGILLLMFKWIIWFIGIEFGL